MIYYYRSERYEQIINQHNYRVKFGYSDSESSDDEDSSSDSSMDGRKRIYISHRR